MLDWLVTYAESILIGVGAVVVAGLLFGFLAFAFKLPTWLRVRRVMGLGLLIVAVLLWKANGNPGGIVPKPQVLDRDTDLDLSTTALARLQAPWDAEGDPRWPVTETLAEMSDAAYEPPTFAAEQYAKMGLKSCEPIVSGSMVGYVVSQSDVAVIVFRGTDFNEWSDWGVNKSVRSIKTEHGRIHSGFYRAYQGLSGQVERILAARKPAHVWVTGHSLGGALATVCAYELERAKGKTLRGVVTFGQPMVARLDLAEHLDQELHGRYVWFVNDADIVPRTPDGYQPAGSLVWLRPGGSVERWTRRQFLRAAPGEAASVGPLPPLSASERSELREELRAKPPNAFANQQPQVVEGVPQFDGHLMVAYLAAVRELLGVLPSAGESTLP